MSANAASGSSPAYNLLANARRRSRRVRLRGSEDSMMARAVSNIEGFDRAIQMHEIEHSLQLDRRTRGILINVESPWRMRLQERRRAVPSVPRQSRDRGSCAACRNTRVPVAPSGSRGSDFIIDSLWHVGIIANMKAELLQRDRMDFDDGAILEMVIWRVPAPGKRKHSSLQVPALLRPPWKANCRIRQRAPKGRSQARWRSGGPIRFHERGDIGPEIFSPTYLDRGQQMKRQRSESAEIPQTAPERNG